MKIKQERWTVKDFINEKESIQISPAWQRGAAWTAPRQVLLIDSILRGLDIPKIYLRVRKLPSAYSYDAVDGQQRLRSIWLFHGNELPLTHPDRFEPIEGADVNGLTFSQLPTKLRNRFERFPISVARIVDSDQTEISRLFARLQQGVPLNPAELRNAMLGAVRNEVEAIALSHAFFQRSRIPEARYRRQDYVAHIFALAAHGISRDIKATNLKQVYEEFHSADTDRVMRIAAEVNQALTTLNTMNGLLGYSLRHKWIVVDLAWLIIQWKRQDKKINVRTLAKEFKSFDQLRRKFTATPEKALATSEISKNLGRHLYRYLTAFKLQGGIKSNVEARSKVLAELLTV